MSSKICNTGTIGFPLTLIRNISSQDWKINDDKRNLIISPIDFDVTWSSKKTSKIKVVSDLTKFQITDINTYTDNTSITYGIGSDLITYAALPILSITSIQHPQFVSGNSSPTHEIIMAFTIRSMDKSKSPMAPDIILLCRPAILVESTTVDPFWKAVDDATKGTASASGTEAPINLASIYTYDAKTLHSMFTYESCIPAQFKPNNSNSLKAGSILLRTHVVSTPLSITLGATAKGKCQTLNTKYSMPLQIKNRISYDESTNYILYNFGTSRGGSDAFVFPSDANVFIPMAAPRISDWDSEVSKKVAYLVPEAFLGKSLAEIANATIVPKRASINKQYKCYTIDPTKDIVEDQIVIDPTTGEDLRSIMEKDANEASGGDPALSAALAGGRNTSDISSQDIEQTMLYIVGFVGAFFIVAYFSYVIRNFMDDLPDKYYHFVTFATIMIVYFVSMIFMGRSVDNKKNKNK